MRYGALDSSALGGGGGSSRLEQELDGIEACITARNIECRFEESKHGEGERQQAYGRLQQIGAPNFPVRLATQNHRRHLVRA